MPFHIMEGRGGGAEVQAWLLAKELARRGFRVSYIAQSINNQHGQQEFIDGVDVRWVRYARHFQWSNGLDYYRVLRDIAPDIVVQRMTSFLTGVIGYYCKKNTKKFVWICTDDTIPVKWLFSRNQIRVNRAENVNLLKASLFLSNAFIYDISRHSGMKRIDYPFTQNDVQRQLLMQAYNLDSYHMISGHHPPLKPGLPSKDKLSGAIVLWVANLAQSKRPENFVELARLGKGSGLRFVMIGSRGDPDYLKALFKDQPGNLEWLGQLPFEETLTWFDRAAFFVNTSIPEGEGFPNTYIQAWLRGVPVISLAVDPDNVIEENSLGFLAKDVSIIYDIIKFYRNKLDKYREISETVLSYSRLHYSVIKMTDRFLETIL